MVGLTSRANFRYGTGTLNINLILTDIMTIWLQELLTEFNRAPTEARLFDALSVAAGKLGFEYCSFGVKMPLPRVSPQIFIFDNYPRRWRERYAAQNYVAIDPTVAHGIRSVLPLMWSDSNLQRNTDFWQDARAHGLRTGWVQSCYNAQGVCGMLTLARSDDALTDLELQTNQARMVLLAQAAHEGFATRLAATHVPEFGVVLSERERAVLQWSAEGKSAAEVGDMLHLSERTVNHYMSQAMSKLDASNKMAAVMKAMSLGLI